MPTSVGLMKRDTTRMSVFCRSSSAVKMTRSGAEIVSQVRKSVRLGPSGIVARTRLFIESACVRPASHVATIAPPAAVAAFIGSPARLATNMLEEQRPKHVGRNERDAHPSIAAANPVLHVGQRVKRD